MIFIAFAKKNNGEQVTDHKIRNSEQLENEQELDVWSWGLNK